MWNGTQSEALAAEDSYADRMKVDLLAAVVCSCLFPLPVLGEDGSLDSLEVAPGLEVTLWAESPLLYNPTALDVDEAGRLWVTEAVNYRKWGGRNPGLEFAEGDRVVVLSDEDGDGVAETSTVFAQDEELVSPLGLYRTAF